MTPPPRKLAYYACPLLLLVSRGVLRQILVCAATGNNYLAVTLNLYGDGSLRDNLHGSNGFGRQVISPLVQHWSACASMCVF